MALNVSVTVVVEAPSVTAPPVGTVRTGVSFVPVIVIVKTWLALLVPSVVLTVKVSSTVVPAAIALVSASVLSNV